MTGDDAELRCLIPFPDQSDSFVHGYEAGELSARMKAGESEIERPLPYHSANRTLFERMAAVYGYRVTFWPCEDMDEWVWATFARQPRTFDVIEGGRK